MQRRAARGWTALGVGAAALGLGRAGARLAGRRLGIPPAHYRVGVDGNRAVPMPDGVTLYADHYYPRAPGPFPTILVRSPTGAGGTCPTPSAWA